MEHTSDLADAEVGFSLMVCYNPCPLPPFRLRQVEAQFAVAKLSSQQTCFPYLAAALPHEITLELFNILSTPSSEAPHNRLKTAIIKLFAPKIYGFACHYSTAVF